MTDAPPITGAAVDEAKAKLQAAIDARVRDMVGDQTQVPRVPGLDRVCVTDARKHLDSDAVPDHVRMYVRWLHQSLADTARGLVLAQVTNAENITALERAKVTVAFMANAVDVLADGVKQILEGATQEVIREWALEAVKKMGTPPSV